MPPTFNQLFEINELKTQSQEKDTVIRKLKDRIKSLSGKDSVENVKKDIDEIERLIMRGAFHSVAKNYFLRNGRELKEKEQVAFEIQFTNAVLTPGMFKLDIETIFYRLKNTSGDAMRELLVYVYEVYVSKTCPSLTKSCEKLVVVTPMNKDKKVSFAEPVTSSRNIPKQTDSLRAKDSNNPLLTSTGVNTTTGASGSKPSGNTKKNRNSRPPSRN
ncbi:hypothetical protein Tco_1437989 [Tanacetum coccineum]